MTERAWTSAALLVAALAAPVGAALFKVWVSQDTVQVGYRLSEREEERRRLRNELRQLEIELAAERSPARLGDLAHNLGLEPPAPQQIVGGARPVSRPGRDLTPVATAEPRVTSGSPSALREALGRHQADGKGREKPDARARDGKSNGSKKAGAPKGPKPRPSALETARALAGSVATGDADGRP